MKTFSHTRLSLLAFSLLTLVGCDSTMNQIRLSRIDQPSLQPVQVKPRALAVNLQLTPGGQGLNDDSLALLNKLLSQQGRLAKQTLTITPWSVRGEQLAPRLANALANAGADKRLIRIQPRIPAAGRSGDLQVQSQALAVITPECQINNPDELMVKPFEAVGYLGCANQSNLARMVAEPRDLIQARALDEADGVYVVNSVERYQNDKAKDLINFNLNSGGGSGGGGGGSSSGGGLGQ